MSTKKKIITKNPKEIIIKHKNLSKVIQDCHDHIRGLLKTSIFLHNNDDFPLSIVICILAFEEINKIAVLGDYYRKLKDVPRSEIEKLRDHKYKLTQFIELERLRENKRLKQRKSSIEEIKKYNKMAEEQKKMFLTLNGIKQLGMYYDYNKGKTMTLEVHFMKNKITKNNLGHFCLFLHEITSYSANIEALRSLYGTSEGLIDSENPKLKKNKHFIELSKLERKIHDPKYLPSLHKFQSTAFELEKLLEYYYN